jgi:hypothetical protein
MASKAKPEPEPEIVVVVATVPVHHGTRAHPQCAVPGQPITLPRELALQLLAAGKARRPDD